MRKKVRPCKLRDSFICLSMIVAVVSAFVLSGSGILAAHRGGKPLGKSSTVPILMGDGGVG